MKRASIMVAAIVFITLVLLPLAYQASGFSKDYIEIAYVDKKYSVSLSDLRDTAYKVLGSQGVDWNRVVYARVFLLDVDGEPILYAKAFMVPQAPITTTCTVYTVTTSPATIMTTCKTITTEAPLNTGFTYYPSSNGMEAVYVKARLSIEDNKVSDIKIIDAYKTVLGKNIWDPIALGNIVAESVWETQAVVEAITKTVVAENLKPDKIWLSTAELVFPPEHLVSVIFLADNYVYGVIYDWGHHKIIVAGLDIIEPPYYIPGQQHSMPTTTIAVTTTSGVKTASVQTTTLTIITYPTTTMPTSEQRLPSTTTTSIPTTTPVYGSGEQYSTTQATIPTTTIATHLGESETSTTGQVYEAAVVSRGQQTLAEATRVIDTYTVSIVAVTAVIAAVLSWVIVRRLLI